MNNTIYLLSVWIQYEKGEPEKDTTYYVERYPEGRDFLDDPDEGYMAQSLDDLASCLVKDLLRKDNKDYDRRFDIKNNREFEIEGYSKRRSSGISMWRPLTGEELNEFVDRVYAKLKRPSAIKIDLKDYYILPTVISKSSSHLSPG